MKGGGPLRWRVEGLSGGGLLRWRAEDSQVEGREVRWIVRWRALKSGGSTTTPPLHLFFDEPRTCKLEKISDFFSKSVEIGVHGTGARKNFRFFFKKC